MKRQILTGVIIIFMLASCHENDDPVYQHQTGTVVDYAGSGNCKYVIELNDGRSIIPVLYPEEFVFAHGQKVWVEFSEFEDVNMSCEKGAACEINRIEELGCSAYVDLYFNNYDSLARDPVYIHEAYIDGDCLHIKLSYGGGCEEHTVDLARMHPWSATSPLPPPAFEIRHDAKGDMCEAYITRELRFDLSPLKEEGAKSFTLSAKLLTGDEYYQKTFNYNYE